MDDPGQVARAVARRNAGVAGLLLVMREDDDGRLRVLDASGDAQDAASLGGARLVDHVLADDLETLRATQQAARERGEQRACQVRLSQDDAGVRWFEVRYLPGVTDGLLVLLRDVSDLRRVAAEAEVLRRVTELANSVTDAGEAVRGAVADLRETLGWRGGRVLRVVDGALEPAGGWSTAEDAEELPEVVGEVAPTGTDVAERAVARGTPVASGRTTTMPRALLDAGVTAVVAVPVTVDDEVAHVLEFHAGGDASLDDEHLDLLAQVGRQLGWVAIRERSLAEVERSHDELARSNAELERFAYVASHDLQEPLRKIIGFTELLEEHHEPLDEDEAEYRGYVKESAQRLQRLIKDLLAYSRAGRRELADEPVDLGEVTDQVLDDLALVIEEEGATVEVGDLPVVRGDDGQLREVVQNLVSNALKYRAEDRPPYITISERHDDQDDQRIARVVVADNGIGIASDQRTSVFEMFRRLHPAHAYGGTGLGLAMVERIVHRHGGTVEITDSPLGDGIAVHLTLPRAQEQP